MLQQTQVQTVIPYYERFLKRFPTVETLALADIASVLKAWEGLGYYARARNLHHAAQQMMEDNDGKLPHDMQSLRKLPGIGQYIAAAVASIAFDQPCAAIDGNVKRVLARLLQIDAPVNRPAVHKLYQSVADTLLDRRSPAIFNQAMMELGALVCKPRNPDCDLCPVSSVCQSYLRQTVDQYPKRTPPRPIPQIHSVAGIVWKDSYVLITRRKSNGLLGGLWEFPGGKVIEGETATDACIREIREETNLDVRILGHLTQVRHAYTHFKVVMDVFICAYISGEVILNGPVDYRWITPNQMDQYAFPKANHKFLHLIQQNLRSKAKGTSE